MRLVLSLLLLVTCACMSAPATAQTPLDPLYQAPGIAPPGANVDCRVSAERPVPVILVHGTFADMTMSWNLYAPLLSQAGFCVYALDLVRRGTAPIEQSGDKLAAFVDDVLARTGAARVSLVGHSQGGMLIRYVARMRGKAPVIDDAIGLAPSHHGTTVPLASLLAPVCPACDQQVAGSASMQALNAGPDEAPAPVSYTVISTRHDQVVTPVSSQALRPGSNVTNVVLQDKCPTDAVEHVGVIYDPVAFQWVLDALSRPGPASPELEPNCAGLEPLSTPRQAEPDPVQGTTDPPPSLALLPLARALRYRNGAVRVPVRCSGPARSVCAGRFELRAGSRLLARKAFSLRATGRRSAMRVSLSRPAKRWIAGRRRAVAVVFRVVVGEDVLVRRYLLRPASR